MWTKPEDDTNKKQSKLDLAWQMLLDVRKQVTCRLWVVMDRWYFSKPFLRQCESQNFDWVTKAKRNTQLFRRLIEPGTGRERFVPVRPKDLIREVYPLLMQQRDVDVASVACENIYLKMPTTSVNRKGEVVVKMKYAPIAAVVGQRVKPDNKTTEQNGLVDPNEPVDKDDLAAEYKGAYLLISNRHDAPKEVLSAWLRRWHIEILFRTAKQELGMLNCHSSNENHIHAHLTLLFTAETLIRYLLWEQRKTAGKEDCTHGQVIRNLICIRCRNRQAARTNEPGSITIDLDTEAKQFARLIRKLWPLNLELRWFDSTNNQLLRATA
ncbi:transposase [Alicyclobacillus acidoterrestris]|uniref:transposase n=1 Tax=Alicyclobacillus acidoterrestris TaxID=1450 RepID=UPI0022A8DF0F|nr:transposase [Alicyclobacillus acidoterrestris]